MLPILFAIACGSADIIDTAEHAGPEPGVYAIGDGYAIPGDDPGDCNSRGMGYCYDVVVLEDDGEAWTYRVTEGEAGAPIELGDWHEWDDLTCDTSECAGLWWGDAFLRPWHG